MESSKNIVIMHNKLSVFDTLYDIISSKYNCIYIKTVAGEFRKIPLDIKIDLFIIDLTDVSKADILYISDRLNVRPYDTQPIIYSGSYYSNTIFKSKLGKLHDLVFIGGKDMNAFNLDINGAFSRFGFDIQVDVTKAVSHSGSNNNSQMQQINQQPGQMPVQPGNEQMPVMQLQQMQMNVNQLVQEQVAQQDYNPYNDTLTHVKLEKQDKPLIMVIDDDVNILTTVAKYLRKEYNVVSVRTTALAFMKIGVRKPDLILLDYMIPICDGKQTLQMIRNQFETSRIPVIMMTSFTEKERVLQCFELGISGYLVKPVSKEDLLRAVNGVFKR